MASQSEVLEILRAHPYSTVGELVEVLRPKDRNRRAQLMNNFSDKLRHLRRWGLAMEAQGGDDTISRWVALEESDVSSPED